MFSLDCRNKEIYVYLCRTMVHMVQSILFQHRVTKLQSLRSETHQALAYTLSVVEMSIPF